VEEIGLSEEIMDFGGGASAVSDNSEYSWFAPFAMTWVAVGPVGIGWHNWQIAAFARSSIGKKAMVVAAKVLAISALELLTQIHIIDKAKKELAERLSGARYSSLIPDDVEPPTYLNHDTMEKYRPLMEKYYERITLENFVNL
jgi:aminobenzoyl-glutamate utilization protein B